MPPFSRERAKRCMGTHNINQSGMLRRFLFLASPGKVPHLLISAFLITWPAAAQADQLQSLSRTKNEPLGSDLTLDGHSLVPNADPNASFTWFGPFSTTTG